MRGTFLSIGQSLQVRRQLELEKALKEKMIHSVMPPKVARWLMDENLTEDYDDNGYHREDGAILKKVRPVHFFIGKIFFFSGCGSKQHLVYLTYVR